MITRNSHNGETVWTLDTETAKLLVKQLKVSKGSWEYNNVVSPLKQAIKNCQTPVFVTEGVATGQIATKMANLISYTY